MKMEKRQRGQKQSLLIIVIFCQLSVFLLLSFLISGLWLIFCVSQEVFLFFERYIFPTVRADETCKKKKSPFFCLTCPKYILAETSWLINILINFFQLFFFNCPSGSFSIDSFQFKWWQMMGYIRTYMHTMDLFTNILPSMGWDLVYVLLFSFFLFLMKGHVDPESSKVINSFFFFLLLYSPE